MDVSEVNAAKSKYDGRLTDEFLIESIGHKFFEHLRVLDLSNRFVHEMVMGLGMEVLMGMETEVEKWRLKG